MRKELGKLNGLRGRFRATVKCFGWKKRFRQHEDRTVMLSDIYDENGTLVADHLWLTIGKQLASLKLEEYWMIEFSARVAPYAKGYFGSRDGVFKPPRIDYNLSYANRFVVLWRPLDRDEAWRQFHQQLDANPQALRERSQAAGVTVEEQRLAEAREGVLALAAQHEEARLSLLPPEVAQRIRDDRTKREKHLAEEKALAERAKAAGVRVRIQRRREAEEAEKQRVALRQQRREEREKQRRPRDAA